MQGFDAQEQQQLIRALSIESEQLDVKSRRRFLSNALVMLGGSVAFGGSSLASPTKLASPPDSNVLLEVPTWSKQLGAGVLTNPYGVPSQYEQGSIRRTVDWLTQDRSSSVSMTPLHKLKGIITPNGLVFERHHAGVPNINPDQHRLIIHGLVDNPLVFSLEDLHRFPSTSQIKFIECPANGGMEWKAPQMPGLQFTHGMLSCCEWTGVKLSTLLAEVGIKPSAKWILAEGADGAAMTRSIPLEKALDDTLVVYAQNGEALRPEQGYPIRLLNPGWEGNTSIKWLRRLKLGDKPWNHREETSKYTDLMPDGRARQFSFVQECNSVITTPCPENPLTQKGWYEIEGLAWSGNGTIKGVDISLDGGINWQPARLKGLVLEKCLTRFSLMVNWQAEPLLLQSRAYDQTGYVQPTFKQLRAIRGGNSIYHKNAIHTWQVHQDGSVQNVQLV